MSALARGLRDLAVWVEQNPDLAEELSFSALGYLSGKEALADAARAFGSGVKVPEGSFFTVRRSFGPIDVDFYTDRDRVCKRVVVDTVEHPERVVPAYTEEIVEWECTEPLFAGGRAA